MLRAFARLFAVSKVQAIDTANKDLGAIVYHDEHNETIFLGGARSQEKQGT